MYLIVATKRSSGCLKNGRRWICERSPKGKLYHARHRVTENDRELLEVAHAVTVFIKTLRRTSDKMRGKKSSGPS
jgi:hypothetical protein